MFVHVYNVYLIRNSIVTVSLFSAVYSTGAMLFESDTNWSIRTRTDPRITTPPPNIFLIPPLLRIVSVPCVLLDPFFYWFEIGTPLLTKSPASLVQSPEGLPRGLVISALPTPSIIYAQPIAELDVGQIHPRIGLGWVGSGPDLVLT